MSEVEEAVPPAAAIPSSEMALSPHPHLEYLGWGPTGNAFVFVYKSNLYYRDGRTRARIDAPGM